MPPFSICCDKAREDLWKAAQVEQVLAVLSAGLALY